MKIQLKRLETNETLIFEFTDSSTLHDLRLHISESTPSSVNFSLYRNDELFPSSSQTTLQSLGVKSGDLIYYSLDSSNFSVLNQKFGFASSAGKLTAHATLGQVSETNQPIVNDPMSIDAIDPSVEERSRENMVTEGPELGGMDHHSGGKRLSEPLFLKKILLEECGDTCELTIVIMTVHAVMLDSGFMLFNPDSSHMSFSFSEELRSISLEYTLPQLINGERIESISLKFQRLGHLVVVYGSLGVGSMVHKVSFDKRRFVRIVDLLMETLEFEKEDTFTIHDKVLMCWRLIKDGLVSPLLIDLSYKAGLEVPPCLMSLPPELKRKILEPLYGVYTARLACVSLEWRELASDNELWKRKCLKECQHVEEDSGYVVDWKERFASVWRKDWSLRYKVYREIMKARELVRWRT